MARWLSGLGFDSSTIKDDRLGICPYISCFFHGENLGVLVSNPEFLEFLEFTEPKILQAGLAKISNFSCLENLMSLFFFLVTDN